VKDDGYQNRQRPYGDFSNRLFQSRLIRWLI